MCGIGGVWCHEDVELRAEDTKKLRSLAIYLQTRGTDAFGFFNGEKVIKFPSSARDVLSMLDNIKPFNELVEGKNMCLMHTRAATVGDPLHNKNNHPFETKDFVFAHNGCFYYYTVYTLADKSSRAKNKIIPDSESKYYSYDYDTLDPYEILGYYEDDLPETDSFCFVVDLQKEYNQSCNFHKSLIDTIEDYIFIADMAIWVYNKPDDSLALFRFDKPLYIADVGDKLWFASELWMLKELRLKNIKSLDDGELRIYERDGSVTIDYVDDVLYMSNQRKPYCGLDYDDCHDRMYKYDKRWFDFFY